ncbi:mitochondrial antiviral-signaling protein isoform X2 [Erinaceus europaeus]|uniref:Mitochondrial antiviral-signaling protein isoform X2 n=1 Tax=Erinaceus europaeus TaxID=9365 RepID=A0ABM3X2B6_ERIEU|nr:mitochondrial antiviral-signaling protein isoform X2 [Erinaceus europaeus]
MHVLMSHQKHLGGQSVTSPSTPSWAKALSHFRIWTAMLFAEEKTFQHIRQHHSNFCTIHVLEILPDLYCLTTSDQDRIRAHFNQWGNKDTLWEVFDRLRRRPGWVECFIKALRACEHTGLADEITRVYQRYLPRTSTQPVAAVEPPSNPAEAPGPSTLAVGSSPCNSIRDESGHPIPVQDTQPLQSQEEDSKKTALTHSSGADLRESGDLLESSDMAARSYLPSSGQQDQDTESDSPETGGMVSSPTSTRGPVSPSVSFQPLARSTPRASNVLGPPMSSQYTGSNTSSSSGFSPAEGPEGQAEATIYSTGPGVPTSSVTTSTMPSEVPTSPVSTIPVPSKVPTSPVPTSPVPSKVPTSPVSTIPVPSKVPTSSVPTSAVPSKVPTSPVPSKLPTSSVATSTVPSRVPVSSKPPATVPTSLAPSRLPINLTRAGTAPPRTPAGLVPEHKMPTSPIRNSSRSAEETPTSPVPPVAAAGGSSAWPKSSPDKWSSERELSKPGRLVSQPDSQYSGTSEDLAISYSRSVGTGRDNAPEENEYQSVETIRINITESPSLDLLENNPDLYTAPKLEEKLPEEKLTVTSRSSINSWGFWFSATAVATAGVLLAVLLIKYRRRLLQ